MQINLTGRHMDITDAIRDHAHAKVQHDFAEFPRIQSVHLILAVEKYRHIAEVVVHAPNHIQVEAQHESDDMYASIDGAVEKATKQIRKVWEKMSDHKSRESIADVEREVRSADQQPGG